MDDGITQMKKTEDVKMIECCGNCERYTYEGKDKKGYCDWYGSYYYPTDSCSHFKEGDENVSEVQVHAFLLQLAVFTRDYQTIVLN